MLPPLRNTREFVARYQEDHHQYEGYWAWLGFAFLSMAEGFPRTMERHPDWSPAILFAYGIPLALLIGASLHALGIGGLWLWCGAKLAGGKQAFRETVKLAGLACFWPGLLIFPALIVQSFTYEPKGEDPIFGLAVVWHVFIGLWGWFKAVNAVRLYHGLGVFRAVIILIWLPAVLVVGILIFMRVAS